jgi:PAS domain S-box-containing protein
MGGADGDGGRGSITRPVELLEAILDHAPDFIALLSPTGELRFVNRVAPGLEPDRVIGSSIYDWVPGDQKEVIRRAVVRSIETRQPTSYEVTGQGPGGELAQYESRMAPIVEDDRVVAVVLISSDVTRRKQAEEQLRQAQKLEAVGELTAGIAHNFNNMLMGIVPNIELAARRAPADIATYLDEAARAAQKASELVKQMMIFARPRGRGQRSAVAPRELINGAVDICRNIFPREIEIELDLTGELPTSSLDASQIEQALVNCLLNARDAMLATRGRQHRLRVRGALLPGDAPELGDSRRKRDGPHLLIEVADNGCGMSAEVAKRIFEPFYTTKGSAGSGLGLATTYAIVEEHGGWIDCRSRLGDGTTLSIFLPVVDPPPALAEPATVAMPRASRAATIALVDDEPLVRRAVGRVLEAAGYRVVQASDGAEARELLDERAGEIDLLLLDLSLPRVGGRSLIEELGERRPQLPIVVFTGAVDTEDLPDRCEIVRKPVMPAALIEAVERALDR